MPSGTLQMVGEVKYAPTRDIVYLYPAVLKEVAGRLEDSAFKPLHAWLDSTGVTLDDLGEAAGAYARLMNMAHQTDTPIEQAMELSGWFAVKDAARIAYMFYVGAMMTGTFFRGVREACPPEGDPSISKLSALLEDAKRLESYAALPAWKRYLFRWSKWYRRVCWRGRGITVK